MVKLTPLNWKDASLIDLGAVVEIGREHLYLKHAGYEQEQSCANVNGKSAIEK
ncbi:hypothetical protein ACSFA7_32080 [Variovorax sp. LT1R20]|uniref:hypothetical protein n=1 Tax=Variovorax sp. LT1R20 TaxID=3443729 RepID=UPI003F46DD17